MTQANPTMNDLHAQTERAREAKRNHLDMLMSKANVVGVGIGFRKAGGRLTQQVALVVMVKQKLPRAMLDPQDILPAELDGVAIDVQEIGEPTAF